MPDLVEQLRQLSELHQNGQLSDTEFEAAKTLLLGGPPPVTNNTSLLALQNELAALDRQWTIEREKFRVVGRRTNYIPEPGSGTRGGIAAAVFGGIWTLVAIFVASGATQAGAPPIFWIFPVVGVVVIISGLSQVAQIDGKANDYQVAESQYQAKRAALEARIRALM